MRRRVRKVVAYEHIVRVAAPFVPIERMLTDFTERFSARKAEKPVAAVRHGILRDNIFIVLLEGKNSGRILSPVVNAMTVASHTEVQCIPADDIPRGPPESNSPA